MPSNRKLQLALVALLLAPATTQAAGFFDDLFGGSRSESQPQYQPQFQPPPEPRGNFFDDLFGRSPPPRPYYQPNPNPQPLQLAPVLEQGVEKIVKPISKVANAASVAEIIRLSLQAKGSIQIGKKYVNIELVKQLYSLRGFQPIFVSDKGPLPLARTVYEPLVATAASRGLHYSFYWPATEIDARTRTSDPRTLAELDLLLAQSLIQYAIDTSTGRTNPAQANQNVSDIEYAKRRFTDFALLNQMLTPEALIPGLQSLEPKSPVYVRMVSALERLVAAKDGGGWSDLYLDKVLKPGMRSPAVPAIRTRLFDLGLLPETARRLDQNQLYDSELEAGIRALQAGMKTAADGVVGSGTLKALDISLDKRIGQLRANLERWRLMPREFGPYYIQVDLGSQTLRAMQEGREIMQMKVIVGKVDRQTPSFYDEIGSVIVNPYWYAPGSIVVKDILPHVMQDPSYFDQLKMKVLDNGREVDTSRIDPYYWSQFTPENPPPFTFREDPGPNNSLGRIKFNLTKNNHAIYMHDTNHPELFANSLRIFSSGCIRLERPIEFGELVLRSQGITKDQILSMIADPLVVAKQIKLQTPIPVYIMSTTVSLADNGSLLYGPDIYGQDERMVGALDGLRVAEVKNFFGSGPAD